jgi:hypothetical protein
MGGHGALGLWALDLTRLRLPRPLQVAAMLTVQLMQTISTDRQYALVRARRRAEGGGPEGGGRRGFCRRAESGAARAPRVGTAPC